MAKEPPYSALCDLPEGGAVGKLLQHWNLPDSGRHISVMNRINNSPPVSAVKVFPTLGKWVGTRGQFLQFSDIRNLVNACVENDEDKTDAHTALKNAVTQDMVSWREQLLTVMRNTQNPLELAYAVMLNGGYKDLNTMVSRLYPNDSTLPIGRYLYRSKEALNKGRDFLPEFTEPFLALIDDETTKQNAQRILVQKQPQSRAEAVDASRRGNTDHGGPG